MSQDTGSDLAARMRRYGSAALGPVTVAGAQFLLSFFLLHRLDLADFGRFAFLLVVSQLSIGLWSALFAAPLLVAAVRSTQSTPGDAARSLAASSGLALFPALLLLGGVALALGTPLAAACSFGVWGSLLLARQFVRAWSLTHRRPIRTVLSDLGYGLTLLAGCAALFWSASVSLLQVAMLLLASAFASLATFLRAETLTWVSTLRWSDALRYRSVWQRDARWSLLGVLTTELTVNSQSYLVTAIGGAGAFAPIAATALLIRPVTVAINALTEFERARFAHDLEGGRFAAVRTGRLHLRRMLFGIWIVTLIAALTLFLFNPLLLFPAKFEDSVLWLGALLWFAVVLSRGLHAAEGAVLLAAGRFRQLAWMSSWTALISLAAVMALVLALGPIWSIAGIFIGESCFAFALFRAAKALLRTVDTSCHYEQATI